jgi:hypothetical protein
MGRILKVLYSFGLAFMMRLPSWEGIRLDSRNERRCDLVLSGFTRYSRFMIALPFFNKNSQLAM